MQRMAGKKCRLPPDFFLITVGKVLVISGTVIFFPVFRFIFNYFFTLNPFQQPSMIFRIPGFSFFFEFLYLFNEHIWMIRNNIYRFFEKNTTLTSWRVIFSPRLKSWFYILFFSVCILCFAIEPQTLSSPSLLPSFPSSTTLSALPCALGVLPLDPLHSGSRVRCLFNNDFWYTLCLFILNNNVFECQRKISPSAYWHMRTP